MIEWREIKNKKEPSGSFFASGLCVAVDFFHLLQVADFLGADVHFLADILHGHAALVHHYHHVVEYVVDLTDQLGCSDKLR